MARQLVITQNITLDGVVEATDDWFGPADSDGDGGTDMLATVREHMAEEVGFLVGRQTFEDMRGFWPNQTGDTTGITAHLDDVAKYVVSSTLTDPRWQNSTVLRGGDTLTKEVVEVLADGPDGTVGVTGSIRLCHDLLAADLVDEMRLFVFPVVLGRGRRLFPDGVELRSLSLAGSRSFRSGVTLQRYRLR
ncbi:dihydrofolate reductase family protein [Pseudonocardia endophytica]|uniref:Dihydrofolate reductase n=1 Tax=Pseudonocardia endophytica TaxID=401976 RepID=A0A4R1HS16_PSEEN|nr:dihydrofolate reductase family protein [Pseudonocardia endophytica]TCK20162.1 dihydrofolate reductase [Pseudonocardia endophytica]